MEGFYFEVGRVLSNFIILLLIAFSSDLPRFKLLGILTLLAKVQL